MVSTQPILGTSVETRLPPEDRLRIWACWDKKVQAEQARVESIKKGLRGERIRLEAEIRSFREVQSQVLAQIEHKKALAADERRRREEEAHRTEEERRRRQDEEQRKENEELQKIKAFKAGEKDDPLPLSPPKISPNGILLVMKDTEIYAEPAETSRPQARAKKYDILETIRSRPDEKGRLWHQVIVGERIILERGKKSGWTPEEKIFWIKNKLLVWVYPGDPARATTAKPLKLPPQAVYFTGRKATLPQRPILHEVVYEVKSDVVEKLLGWVDERAGIHRPQKTREEMQVLLRELAKSSWPPNVQLEILRGEIETGFTTQQVLLSWGFPSHVNSTRTLVGVHEQWVYGDNPFPQAYVYFEKGVVKSWELLNRSK